MNAAGDLAAARIRTPPIAGVPPEQISHLGQPPVIAMPPDAWMPPMLGYGNLSPFPARRCRTMLG